MLADNLYLQLAVDNFPLLFLPKPHPQPCHKLPMALPPSAEREGTVMLSGAQHITGASQSMTAGLSGDRGLQHQRLPAQLP